MFIPDKRLEDAIAKRVAKHELNRLAIEAGMETILESGIEKVLQGLTTVDEILRVCPVERGTSAQTIPTPDQKKASVKPAKAASPPQDEIPETCKHCGATLEKEWMICPMCGTLKSEVPDQLTPHEQEMLKQVDVPKWKELIVMDENDADVSRMIKFFLQQQGYQVILAADGEEALEKIRAERPDVVILDINMPKKDGFAVCKAMRSSVETYDRK